MCELVINLKLSVEEANKVLETLKQVSTMFCGHIWQSFQCFAKLAEYFARLEHLLTSCLLAALVQHQKPVHSRYQEAGQETAAVLGGL